jgi:cell shape-determining protein MreC
MKTTYRRANIDERRKVFILAGIIAVGIFLLCLPSVRGVISRVVYSTAPSLWETGNNIGNTWSSFWGEFHAKRALVLENETLKEQVSRMEAQILDRNLLAEQVAALEESLGRNPEDDRVLARVLAGPGAALYDTLSVDVGSNLGVTVGDQVVYSGSSAIGAVVEVYPKSSKIELLSSPGEKTQVLLGKDSIPVVATGKGMGNFEVLIPEGSNLAVGDIVTLPPGGLVLGTVGAIESKPSEPLVRVLFRTSFNISNIRSVEILVSRQVR